MHLRKARKMVNSTDNKKHIVDDITSAKAEIYKLKNDVNRIDTIVENTITQSNGEMSNSFIYNLFTSNVIRHINNLLELYKYITLNNKSFTYNYINDFFQIKPNDFVDNLLISKFNCDTQELIKNEFLMNTDQYSLIHDIINIITIQHQIDDISITADGETHTVDELENDNIFLKNFPLKFNVINLPNNEILLTLTINNCDVDSTTLICSIIIVDNNLINTILPEYRDSLYNLIKLVITNVNKTQNDVTYNLQDTSPFNETVFSLNSSTVIESTNSLWENKNINDCNVYGEFGEYITNISDTINTINNQINQSYKGFNLNELFTTIYILNNIIYVGIIKHVLRSSGNGYIINSVDISSRLDDIDNVRKLNNTHIVGNFKVSNYEEENIIMTDDVNKITVFNDKVGINNSIDNIEALLDIDNLSYVQLLTIFNNNHANVFNMNFVINYIKNIDKTQLPVINPLVHSLYKANNNYYDNMFNNELVDFKNQCITFEIELYKTNIPEQVDQTTYLKTNIFLPEKVYITYNNLNVNFNNSNSFLLSMSNIYDTTLNMMHEYNKIDDPNYIFSFMELIEDVNTHKWYIATINGIIRKINYDELNNNNKLICVMTLQDVTQLMNDLSYISKLQTIIEYFSRLHYFQNFSKLLLLDPDILHKLLVNKDSVNSITKAISEHPYFSNRLQLYSDSYLYFRGLDEDNQKVIFNENIPESNGVSIYNLWDGEVNLSKVINDITIQYDNNYPNIINSIVPVNYKYGFKNKLSCVSVINISGKKYILGGGVILNTLLSKSLLVKGDTTINGNFYVNDLNNNNIFNIDNDNKTMSNIYRVGIGTNPKSILDVKDTSITKIIKTINLVNILEKDINNIIPQLRNTIVNNYEQIINSKINQNIENYISLYEINTTTLFNDDCRVIYDWYNPSWVGYKLKDITDNNNIFTLTIIKNLLQDILSNNTFFDNACITKVDNFIFGKKMFKVRIFKSVENKTYFIINGINLQSYGIRTISNFNIDLFINTISLCHKITNQLTNQITTYINQSIETPTINTIFNQAEGVNDIQKSINRLLPITIDSTIIKIDLNNINDTTVRINNVNYNNNISITISEEILVKNMNINDTAKYVGLYNVFIQDCYNESININDYFIISYDDLHNDYLTIVKCIKITENYITLLCTSTNIQSIVTPTLNIEGDVKVSGDMIITNEETNINYVSIDPDMKYIGINTDERYLYYPDTIYSTTTTRDLYNARHNIYITNSSYPVTLTERVQENINDTSDQTNMNYRYFSTYSSFTTKRKSNLYTFDEITSYSTKLQEQYKIDNPNDTITHMKYGTDIAYEVCDKLNRSVELGNVQMVIDKIDSNGNLKGGFSIQVIDSGGLNNNFESSRRNLMYVDNESTLFIKKINLNGGILSNDNGNLMWNDKYVMLSDTPPPAN